MNPRASSSPTRAACLTPPGTGAIAALAVRGPGAWDILRSLFAPRSGTTRPLPAVPQLHHYWLGRLQDGPAAAAGEEVVVSVKQIVPETWIELHSHGGREVLRLVLEIFERRGVQIRTWQELERLTRNNPGQAAALTSLADARTIRTAAVLLDQYQGAFTRSLGNLQAAWEINDLATAASILQGLVRYADVGRHLLVPWQVVILGPPNAGKSSLINALAGFQRSVVSAAPGTTRDVVTTTIALDGWLMELADTAGLRGPADTLEGLGMDRAVRAAEQADLCLWVLDASVPPVGPELKAKPSRLVVNKIDLPPAADFVAPPGAIAVSAKTAAGIDELCRALVQWLVPDPPPEGAAVPFTPALCDAVEEMHHCSVAGRIAEARRLLEKLWE